MGLALRSVAVVGGLLLGLALPATANAWYSNTEGAVGLRSGPGVKYKRLAVIPAGARIWVEWCKPRWCSVLWKGRHGFVAASYVANTGGLRPQYYYYDDYYWLHHNDYYWWPNRPHKPRHWPPKPPPCAKSGDCKPPKPPKPPITYQQGNPSNLGSPEPPPSQLGPEPQIEMRGPPPRDREGPGPKKWDD